jgi:hypothetical protein
MIRHQGVLMRQRLGELQEANKTATRRRSHKRKRVHEEETLTVKDGVRLTTLQEFEARSDRKKAKKRARVEVGRLLQRRCRHCSEMEHNTRTYKKNTEGTIG